ncbi:unnamed protein product [Brachionus calyciflorus]|uniref:Nuclear pore complex protein Nup153 n=1 Tax=Brachionus calyciflorus TaxID=104777 RepID=A0A813M7S0_9BILA|nr:unnamed protein product [Brachionus calyciflorus]
MFNDQNQTSTTTSTGLLFKPFNTSSSVKATSFDFIQPTKLTNIVFNEIQFKKLLNLNILKFNFNEPIRLLTTTDKKITNFLNTINNDNNLISNQPTTTTPNSTILNNSQPSTRNHVILVEQAPFSVFKSVKSQEQNDENKSNNNIVVINSNRNHPYNNSIRPSIIQNPPPLIPIVSNQCQKPTDSIEPKQQQISTSSITITEIDKKPVKSTPNVPQVGTTTTTTTTTTTINPSAKAIIRNSSSNAILAHIKSLGPNFKSIFVRPKNTKHIDSSEILHKNTGIGKKTTTLLDKSSLLDYKQLLIDSSKESKIGENLITNILPRIEPKEIKINQSVDDILRKFSSENEKSSKPSVPSPLGKSTPSKIVQKTENLSTLTSPQVVEKWTCMVCLSKHLEKIEICSICGSSRPEIKPQKISTTQNISFSKPVSQQKSQPNKMAFFEEAKPSEKDILSVLQDEDYYVKKSSAFQPRPNPYLKKWTCQHCNYSNDSLKIVCLNCRWVKTSTTKAKQGKLLDETIKSPSKSKLDQLDTEIESPIKKCKIQEETKISQEPKSSGFFAKPLSSQKKWNCDTCLVQNDETNEKCACCSASKPGIVQQKPKKWNCPTCLTANDDDKLKCPCCETDKPGAAKAPSLTSAPTLTLPSASSIKIGLPATDSNTKVSFGTTGGFSFGAKKDEAPSAGFSFGAKKDEAPTGGFSFGAKSLETKTGGFGFKPLEESKKEETKKDSEKLEIPKTSGFSLSGEGANLFKLSTHEKLDDKKTESPFKVTPISEQKKDEVKSVSFSFPSFGTGTVTSDKKETEKTAPTTGFCFKAFDSTPKNGSTEATNETKTTSNLISFGMAKKDEDKQSNPLFGLSVKPLTESQVKPSISTTPSIFENPKKDTEKPVLNIFGSKTGSETSSSNLSFFGSSTNQFESAKKDSDTLPKLNFNASPSTPSGSLFGTPKPVESTTTASTVSSTSLFGTSKISETPSTTPAFGALKTSSLFTSSKIGDNSSTTPSTTLPNFSSTTTSLFPNSKIGETPSTTTTTTTTSVLPNFGTTTTSSLFPKTAETSATSTSSIFGAASTPSFGQKTETTSLFGASKPTETSNKTTTGGLFNLSNKQDDKTNLFGAQKLPESSTSTPLFGSTTTTSLFGAKPTESSNTNLFGITSSSTTPSSSLFSLGKTTDSTNKTSTNSLFSFSKPTESTQTTTPATQITTFSFGKPFGSTTTASSTTPFGQFGTTSTPSTSTTTNTLFPTPSDTGSQSKPTGLFGNTPTSSQNEPPKNNFFSFGTPNTFSTTPTPKPAETPFGGSSSFGTGTFGSTQAFSTPAQTGFLNGFDQSSNSMMDDSFNNNNNAKKTNFGENQSATNQIFSFTPSETMNFNFINANQPQNGVIQFTGGSTTESTSDQSSNRRYLKARRRAR